MITTDFEQDKNQIELMRIIKCAPNKKSVYLHGLSRPKMKLAPSRRNKNPISLIRLFKIYRANDRDLDITKSEFIKTYIDVSLIQRVQDNNDGICEKRTLKSSVRIVQVSSL